MVLIAHNHLELLPGRKLPVQEGETLLGVEFTGNQKIEMRGPAGRIASLETVGILRKAVRTHLDLTLEIVPHEVYLGDVTGAGHYLDVGPFNLFRG